MKSLAPCEDMVVALVEVEQISFVVDFAQPWSREDQGHHDHGVGRDHQLKFSDRDSRSATLAGDELATFARSSSTSSYKLELGDRDPGLTISRRASQCSAPFLEGIGLAKRKTLAPWKPSREIQLKSIARRVPDVIAENLNVLFCGINPGLYSAAVGHHFAGPGNLFWPTIYRAGLTPRLFTAFDEAEMAALGYGITNLVPRASKDAEDLTKEELRAGAGTVKRKARKFKPKFLAVLGLAAYRTAFQKTKAQVGYQEPIGSTKVYLLPNPSGLNAFHQPAILNGMFLAFREELLKEDISLPPIPPPPPPADLSVEPKKSRKTTLKTSIA